MKNNKSWLKSKLSLLLAIALLLSILAGCQPPALEQTDGEQLSTIYTDPSQGPDSDSQHSSEEPSGDPEESIREEPAQNVSEPTDGTEPTKPQDPADPPVSQEPTREPTDPPASQEPTQESAETTETVPPTDPVVTEPPATEPPTTEKEVNYGFQIHFLDVGQADAALVLCGTQAMLIDGGNADDSSLIYSHLKNNKIDYLDYVVVTHAHEDHVGGVSGALNYASVGTVYCPVTSYNSKAFNSFQKYVQQRGATITVPQPGLTFSLGSAKVQIIACNSGSDSINTSIILRITYGSTSYLFTGNAERLAEQAAINSGYTLNSTVLIVGHHGSETSSTYPFLRAVMPDYAIISVGKNNAYGHPNVDVLSRLRDAGAKVYRTDMQGTIGCMSNGKTVSFYVTRNPDAQTLGPAAPPATQPPETPTDPPVTQPDTQPPAQETDPSETPAQPPEQTDPPTEAPTSPAEEISYVINKNSGIFHDPNCSSVGKMSEKNKKYSSDTRDELVAQGYKPCGSCKP